MIASFRLKKAEILLPVVLALVPIIVVFSQEKLIPYLIISALLLCFIEKNIRYNFLNNRALLKPYVYIIIVYLLYTFLAADKLLALKVLERQTSLLLIPMIVFSADFSKKRLALFYNSFIFSLLIIGLFSIGVLIWFTIEYSDWILTMNQTSGNTTYLQFKYPHLMGAHPTYWSYLLILANMILICRNSLQVKIKTTLAILAWGFFNLNILYLAARTPILINILLHIAFLIVYLKKRKIHLIKLIILIGLLLTLLNIALNFPLLKFKITSLRNDERVLLWPVAVEQIKANYFILGEGLGQGYKILKQSVILKGDTRINYKEFDLHNQYLTQYLDMGILGFISLLYLISSPFLQTSRKVDLNNLAVIGLCLMFFIALFTESPLYRIQGVLIFAIFSSVFVRSSIMQRSINNLK